MTSEPQAAHTFTEHDLAELTTADRPTLRAAIATVPREQLATVLATGAGADALRAAFARMPEFYTGERFDPPVVARWRVHQGQNEPAADLVHDVLLGDGRCSVEPSAESVSPAVTLILDAVSFIELAFGVRSGVDLLMQGRLQVEGDAGLAVRMESLFALSAVAET